MQARDWEQLYALQDWALARLREAQHGFHLTGGTALSRGYLQHRYSEDLDFFCNDAPEFVLWRDRCLDVLGRAGDAAGMRLEIALREERFGRAFLHGPVALKLEFVNDVPFRVGEPWMHPALGALDTLENILANKISALVDREEPKDVADIYWLCCRRGLDLPAAITSAEGKAAGVFPPAVAKALADALGRGVPRVFWLVPPEEAAFRSGIESLIRSVVEP